ncbi:MAG: VWA domain-containing protein [Polyangiaceae bacterium]
MKPTRVAALAALGMFLTSVTVYSLTPPGGVKIAAEDPTALATTSDDPTAPPQEAPPTGPGAQFQAGTTLHVDGRLGHEKLEKSARGETFVMLEVKADEGKAQARAPVNLSLVIDRSGSMKGNRLRNAVQGAIAAIDQLHDGDVVSVVTFDARTQVLVPPTTIDSSSRSRIRSDVSGITLGGDTCISCGVEDALAQLERTTGRVNRMIVLSDGDATAGVRDIPGFRSMAQRARDRGVAITTIGVDVEYNEKIMTAIAADSNGRHYFVENESALARVFETEAESLTTTLASAAEAEIELAPGVELVRVFDRTFRRSGNRVIVPLGSFTGGDTKTVLVKVRVPSDQEGTHAVANVDLSYRDHVNDTEGHCGGKLALAVTADAPSDLDAVVEGRVNRSETASVLREANDLFAKGRIADANKKLDERRRAVASASVAANNRAPASRKTDVTHDFDDQSLALAEASQQFASPPATPAVAATAGPGQFASPPPAAAPQDTRAAKAAVKQSAKRAMDMGF